MQSASAPPQQQMASASTRPATAPGTQVSVPKMNIANAWTPRQLFDVRVYTSESKEFNSFDDKSALLWQEYGLTYHRDESADLARNFTIRPSLRMLRNETALWLHVYLTKAGDNPDPLSPGYDVLSTASAHHAVIKLVKRKVPEATRNLLMGGSDDDAGAADADSSSSGSSSEAEAGSTEIVPHWKPQLIMSIVEDFSVYPPGRVPPQVLPALTIVPERARYLPVVFMNDFWCPSDQMVALNESSAAAIGELPLELTFTVTNLMRWMLTAQMQQSLEQQASMHGDVAMVEMHRMMTETNPWLLAVTAFVSVLHTVFDMLAFKNDISFWKNKQSMKGLSFRSMLLNLFFQSVIFLYLCDNDTSWMILFSSGMGLAIEVWKLRKAVKSVAIETAPGARVPSLRLTPADSYEFSETKLYDEEAMAYLSLALYPVVVGYAMYSLAYDSHKSWYSWLLGSTVNFVYSFGFVLMTPQLFINYKLKSTAHMPFKTFMYKALNTFIDDLFAFIIKMPMAHRLACLRDDLIFLIYLYQRYIYGIDEKRANEYGQVGGAEGAAEAITEGASPKQQVRAPKPSELTDVAGAGVSAPSPPRVEDIIDEANDYQDID